MLIDSEMFLSPLEFQVRKLQFLCSVQSVTNDSHQCYIDGQHLALRVEFTLGTSQYATMALREIMRAETSSQAQSTISHD
jgi:tRNA(Glu) U13 pseudouridine synthase TruD